MTMIRELLPAAIVTLMLVVPAAAQKPADAGTPPAQSKLKADHYAVTVSGCINGRRLQKPFVQSGKEALPFEALDAAAFALEGPKELIQQIQKVHKNHYDQIVGVAVVPPSLSRADAAIVQKRLGPVSIDIGSRTTTSEEERAPQTITLKVASLVHVENDCTSR